MQLPAHVRRIIEERAEAVGFTALKRAATAMSAAYRQGGVKSMPEAYLVTRMPATYAAAYSVLRQVRERLPAGIASILDIGAGTGAASLAAREWFPEAAITMVERDGAMSEAARWWLPDARIVTDDVTKYTVSEVRRRIAGPLADARGSDRSRDREGAVFPGYETVLPPCDLVIAAYSLGELRESVVKRLWQATRVAMVAIEPGTPSGFARIRGIRAELLEMGARMLAPCPAETACPIVDPDWCHFAARVERSSLHRRIKDAELGYEDEKFSYIALAREAAALPGARAVRRPQHRPGLIQIQICTPGGLRTEHVTKRDRERFRRARKLVWGDEWSDLT